MRYFFNTLNGRYHADAEGTHYPSREAACGEATMFAKEILRDHPDHAWPRDELVVTVTDSERKMFEVMVPVMAEAL
jgi:hypothetical protein